MSLQEETELVPTISFVCERCRGLTMLASIEPHPIHGEQAEVHTFECLECAIATRSASTFGPIGQDDVAIAVPGSMLSGRCPV